jgi:hypothetical protein
VAKKGITPQVEGETTDRAIMALDRFSTFVAKNPMVNGVLVDVEPTEDGHLQVKHGLGKKASGAMVVGSDIGVFSASVVESGKSAATVAVSSNWEIVDRKDIYKVTDSFDFDFDLNGDDDGEYRIEGYWVVETAGAATLRLRVNGLETGSFATDGYAYMRNGTTGSTSGGVALARSLSLPEDDQFIRIEFTMSAPIGENRMSYSVTSQTYGTLTSETYNSTLASKLHDLTTRIVSIGVESSATSDLGVGSHFTLYRRPRLTGRKLKIWIF